MKIKAICLAYIQYTITGQVQDTTVNTPGGKGEGSHTVNLST